MAFETNNTFIDFLDHNVGKLIFLNCWLDASVALEEQWRRVEKEQIDLDKIDSGRFGDLQLPLPNRRDDLVSMVFHFWPGNVLNSSSGGSGTLVVQISGFFEILTAHHSGPSKVFHLKEFDAPLTLRAKFLNRS